MNGLNLLGLLGTTAIAVALLVMGLLSKRLGKATRAAPYYYGFYLAASLVTISVIARILAAALGIPQATLTHDFLWAVIYTGLPALAVTIGVAVAWRYWSWLLAERD